MKPALIAFLLIVFISASSFAAHSYPENTTRGNR